MMASLTYAEYIDWMAFFSVEPTPQERGDYRTLVLASIIINMIARSPGEASRAIDNVSEMFNYWKPQKLVEPQSPDEVASKLRLLIQFSGGSR